MEHGQDPPLQLRVQVDQQVATAQQVQLRERRVLDDVLRCKDQHVANLRPDAVAPATLPVEIALEAFGTDIRFDAFRVDSGPGSGDGLLVDVGAEDLDVEVLGEAIHALAQEDGHRVGLFARGATRHPDAHRVLSWHLGKQERLELLGEGVEGLGIAEETGDTDQQCLEQDIGFAVTLM